MVLGKGDGLKLESRGTSAVRPPEVGSRAPGTKFGVPQWMAEEDAWMWQRRMGGSNEALAAPQDGSRFDWCVL